MDCFLKHTKNKFFLTMASNDHQALETVGGQANVGEVDAGRANAAEVDAGRANAGEHIT